MSIKSAPYYWLECDGCGKGSAVCDYAAWQSVDDAISEAEGNAWYLRPAQHYCGYCLPPWCLECERDITDENPRCDDLCAGCLADDNAEEANR